MQKAISSHTAARKHLSPKLSGKCSATICQLENNLLFICSREHLFSWQAGIQQRELTGTLVVSRAVNSAGDMKETQKLCSMQHGTVWLWWWHATGLCSHDWLEEAFPRSQSPWPWCTPEEGGCHTGLGPQGVPGAAPWGWSCWWPHLQELCCGWGTKWPGTGAVGGCEQTEYHQEGWRGDNRVFTVTLQSYTVQGRRGRDSLVVDGDSQDAESLWLLASGRRVLLCPQIWIYRISTVP